MADLLTFDHLAGFGVVLIGTSSRTHGTAVNAAVGADRAGDARNEETYLARAACKSLA